MPRASAARQDEDMRQKRVLMLGDLVPILVFALLGGAMHESGFSVVDVVRNIALLGAGWLAAALVFRPYASDSLARLAATWAVGITAGVFLRAAALGREVDGEYLGFWGVALAVTLLVLLAWRLLARSLMPRLV
jgi:hypothetical protein